MHLETIFIHTTLRSFITRLASKMLFINKLPKVERKDWMPYRKTICWNVWEWGRGICASMSLLFSQCSWQAALWLLYYYNTTRDTIKATLLLYHLSSCIESFESMDATCTVFSLPAYKATARFLSHNRKEHL